MKFVEISLNVVFIVLIVVCGINANTSEDDPAVVKQAQLVKDSMDADANPCEDFYQYACGKWEELHDDAKDNYDNTENMLYYMADKETEFYFNTTKQFTNEPNFVKQSYNYFKSCVDNDQIKYDQNVYLQWLALHEDSGLISSLTTTVEKKVEFKWFKTLAIYRKYGLNNVFITETLVSRKYENKKETLVDLDKPDDFKNLKYDELKLVIKSLNLTLSEKEIMKLWQEIRTFEWNLNELNEIADTKKPQQLIKVQDLNEAGLKTYLSIVLNQTELNTNMNLFISNVPYIKALENFLDQYDPKFLNKYLEIRFLRFLYDQDYSYSNGCVASIKSLVPITGHWIFEQQHPELKAEVPKINDIFENIRKHFAKILQQNKNNFNSTILEFLEAKLKNTKLNVGYFQDSNTIVELEKIYENFDLSSSDFYGNHLKLLNFNFQTSHSSLNTVPLENSDILKYFEDGWFSRFVNYRLNSVHVSWSLVQEPIYHSNTSDIYKYSSLGYILAQTFFHLFSENGLTYDFNGNDNELIEATILSNTQFSYNYKCLGDLPASDSEYKITAINGLRLVYQQFFDNYSVDLVNDSKLFFLNFAQVFCTTSTDDDDLNDLKDILAHFEEFSKHFKCPENSRMNAKEKCVMWG